MVFRRKGKILDEVQQACRSLALDLLYDMAGSVLYAAGLYTFAKEAQFAPGGLSGLAIILNRLWSLPVGTLTLLLNIPLILISYPTVGRSFLFRTARTMVISTFFLDVIFPFFPVYRGQRIMAALFSGLLLGGGMALFYMRGSSSGGIDFLTMTVKVKRPHLSLGRITMLIDLIIILLGWPVFGDVDSVLFGLLATFVSVVVLDKILYGIGAGTLAFVVTGKGREVAEHISQVTRRGVTSLEGVGVYTGQEKSVLLCACAKSEAYLVRRAVHETDRGAFLMFTETSEVFGEGFADHGGGAVTPPSPTRKRSARRDATR